MGCAHVIGGTARRVGRGARDLDPAHRRDGIAFALLGLVIVVAAREWWGLSGTAGDLVHNVVAGTFGRVGVVVPVVLLGLAIRLMRHPDLGHANSRIGIGLSAITLAVCALVHVSAGTPDPADGFGPVRDAGGVVGYLLGTPLETMLTVYVAVPLLVLLAFFGLLVVTATPVNQVVPRVRAGYDHLTGNSRPQVDADDEPLVINAGHSALPEIEAAALVTVDGLPMASTLPEGMNEDRVAAMSAALLSLGERAADGLGRGGLAQVSIEGEDGSVHLLAAGEEAVLVAVAAAGAKAGLVLFELRRTAAELGNELGRAGERFSQSGAETIDALADLAAVLPVQAAAPVDKPEIPDVAPPPAPYFPTYEPSLPGVGTALAGLEPPFPVLNQHVPTPPEPPATSWPTWS